MRNALLKDTLREIKKRRNQFISIAAIITLGVGFFVGIRVTGSDMRITGDQYFDDSRLMDIKVQTTLGLDDGSLEILKKLDLVDRIYPSKSADSYILIKDQEMLIKTIGLPDAENESDLNLPRLLEGRLPSNEGECLVDNFMMEKGQVQIGDTITLQPEDEETFTRTLFTVSGVVDSPLYLDVQRGYTSIGDGQLEGFIYLPKSAYQNPDVYTEVYLTVQGAAEISCYSDEYKEKVNACIDRIKAVQNDLKAERLAAVKSEPQQKLDDARKEYEENKAKAERELADAKKKLDTAKADLEKGERDFSETISKLYAQLGMDRPVISGLSAQARRLKADIEEYFQSAQTVLDEGYAQLQQIAALPQMQQAYRAQKQVLDAKQTELDAAREQLNTAADLLVSSAAQLEEGRADYEKGLKEYTEQKAKAEKELADAEQKIADAQKEIDDIKSPTVYIQDRDGSSSYSGYRQDSDRIEAIGRVFPLIFFLVAALVCLSTMTRMVEEQRGQIGTLKALGYKAGAIACKYILFALLATLIGLGLGMVLGFNLLPRIIYNAYRILYRMPDLIHPFQLSYILFPAILALICTIGTSYVACRVELRSVPAKLMRPAAPPPGKRVLLERFGLIWKRLSFLQKVTARNIFRNKVRFWMSLLGIAGCMGLLLTGLGLRDSIVSMVDIQFETISTYDAQVLLDKDADAAEFDRILGEIRGRSQVAGSLPVSLNNLDVTANGLTYSASGIVPQDLNGLDEFYKLQERKSRQKLQLTDEGVVIDEKLSILLKVKAGDTITLTNTDEDIHCTAVVAGITENYIFHNVIMTGEYYQKITGKTPQYNTLLLKLKQNSQEDRSRFSEELLKDEAVISVYYTSSTRDTFTKMTTSFDYVIWVVVAAAGALALVVLYNLSTININERVREIATIKVLGFYDMETSAYIFRENVVLTVLGIALGCVFGVFLHQFVVRTAEIDIVMFVRSIFTMSYVYSILLTILFSTLVNVSLHFRLKKIIMATALKSVE